VGERTAAADDLEVGDAGSVAVVSVVVSVVGCVVGVRP
jgi:hypothetical protein